jgi:hypothetical protein
MVEEVFRICINMILEVSKALRIQSAQVSIYALIWGGRDRVVVVGWVRKNKIYQLHDGHASIGQYSRTFDLTVGQ